MKKYNAPLCDVTVVCSHDVITLSGEVSELKFGTVFEMVAAGDGFLMESGF